MASKPPSPGRFFFLLSQNEEHWDRGESDTKTRRTEKERKKKDEEAEEPEQYTEPGKMASATEA